MKKLTRTKRHNLKKYIEYMEKGMLPEHNESCRRSDAKLRTEIRKASEKR